MLLGNSATVTTDVLIIGSGGAALRAAIEAGRRGVDVLLLSKSRIGYGNNTAMAGGALAAANGWREPRDSPEIHFLDTVRGGRFMGNQKMIEVMTERAVEEITHLQEYGVEFRKRNGDFSVIWVPGHTYARTLSTASGIGTGFTLPLRDSAQKAGAKFLENVLVTRLLTRAGRVIGALGLAESGDILIFKARAVILATGGLTQIFARTDNTTGTTGDGMVLAYEAGASLADMEFVQYYPTAIGNTSSRGILYEALVAREGAKLRNSHGEDILEKYGIIEPVSMTRDVVCRAIAREMLAGRDIEGSVRLDLSSIPEQRLGKLMSLLPPGSKEKRSILVAPNAHFTCGGVRIDQESRTDADGLFAAGEVCAGIHGANRIGSNAITDIFIFGAIAGQNAAGQVKGTGTDTIESVEISQGIDELKSISSQSGRENTGEILLSLKKVMWEKAGMIRNEQSLSQALSQVSSLKEQAGRVSITSPKELTQALRLVKMLTVSEMVIRAAIKRTESRGVHYRTDCPERDDKDWLRNIIIRRRNEEMKLNTEPVLLSRLAPD